MKRPGAYACELASEPTHQPTFETSSGLRVYGGALLGILGAANPRWGPV